MYICKTIVGAGKRIQLFAASPGDGLEEIKEISSSAFSPGSTGDFIGDRGGRNSLNNPTPQGASSRTIYGGSLNKTPQDRSINRTPQGFGSGNRISPHNSNNKQAADSYRTRQRFSLGEFITPETESPSTRVSGLSAGRNSPSPLPGNRRSGGKKKGSFQGFRESVSPAPIFSLNSVNDFPPPTSKDTRPDGHTLKYVVLKERHYINYLRAYTSCIDKYANITFDSTCMRYITPRCENVIFSYIK